MAAVTGRKITELRVVDLRQELERRGLDKSGVKTVLHDRLSTALEEEGQDPNEYIFSVSSEATLQKSTGESKQIRNSKLKEIEKGEVEEDNMDNEEEEAFEEFDEEDTSCAILNLEAEDGSVDEELDDEDDVGMEMGDDHVLVNLGDAADVAEDVATDLEDDVADGKEAAVNQDDVEMEDLEGEGRLETGEENNDSSEAVAEGQTEVKQSPGALDKDGSQDSLKGRDDAKKCDESKAAVSFGTSEVTESSSGKPVNTSTVSTKPVSTVNKSNTAVTKTVLATTKTDVMQSESSITTTKDTSAGDQVSATKDTARTKPSAAANLSKTAEMVKTSTPSETKKIQPTSICKSEKSPSPKISAEADSTNSSELSVAVTSDSKDKASTKGNLFVTNEDSFDVSVDDMQVNEIDADLIGNNEDIKTVVEESKVDVSRDEGKESSTECNKPKSEDKTAKENKEDVKIAKSSDSKDSKDKDRKGSQINQSLWVSGLSSATRATDLKTVFSKYGKVVGAKVVTSARTPGSKCYGFVSMSSSDEASKCIQHLHRTELHGKMISVDRAKNEPGIPKNLASKKVDDKKNTGKDPHDHRTEKEKDVKEKPGQQHVKATHQEQEKSRDDKHHCDHKSTGTAHESEKTDSLHKGAEKDKGKDEKVEHKVEQKPEKTHPKDGILTFEKLKAEKERDRLRQKERAIREEERRQRAQFERQRARQKEIYMRQRQAAMKLEEERDQLRIEKQRLERARLETARLRQEQEKLEQERLMLLRLEQRRLEEQRKALKRSFEDRGGRDDDDDGWGGPSKRKTTGRFSSYQDSRQDNRFQGRSGANRYNRKDDTFTDLKSSRRGDFDDLGERDDRRGNNFHPQRSAREYTERGRMGQDDRRGGRPGYQQDDSKRDLNRSQGEKRFAFQSPPRQSDRVTTAGGRGNWQDGTMSDRSRHSTNTAIIPNGNSLNQRQWSDRGKMDQNWSQSAMGAASRAGVGDRRIVGVQSAQRPNNYSVMGTGLLNNMNSGLYMDSKSQTNSMLMGGSGGFNRQDTRCMQQGGTRRY